MNAATLAADNAIRTPRFDEVRVGDVLPPLTLPPISRRTLALYAGASADHNPLHIDSDAAHAAGWPDVFAHGMLSAAYLGRMLVAWAPQERLRSLNLRFSSITHLQETPTCTGEIVEKIEQDGERCVRVAIRCANQKDDSRLVGEALIALA